MKAIKALIAGITLATSSAAFATLVSPGNGTEDGLQTVIQNLYVSGTAPDVNADQAAEMGLFQISASGGSYSKMVIEIAGLANTNTFGIYDVSNPGTKLEIFNGAATGGTSALIEVGTNYLFSLNFGATTAQFAGSTFGYYLGVGDNFFYSDPSMNGGDDHMVAFRGNGTDVIKLPNGSNDGAPWSPNEYLLAWEDQPLSFSDTDYQDMVVMVESVDPLAVPEPTSLSLLGASLFGMGVAIRRRKSNQG